ncbi:hypothetical protein FPQ18DRAFT_300325 [Pyronema domesticum]|nr:hypothetical protein FPQ18DRAFT_300325 [Pyronema domesticum]
MALHYILSWLDPPSLKLPSPEAEIGEHYDLRQELKKKRRELYAYHGQYPEPVLPPQTLNTPSDSECNRNEKHPHPPLESSAQTVPLSSINLSLAASLRDFLADFQHHERTIRSQTVAFTPFITLVDRLTSADAKNLYWDNCQKWQPILTRYYIFLKMEYDELDACMNAIQLTHKSLLARWFNLAPHFGSFPEKRVNAMDAEYACPYLLHQHLEKKIVEVNTAYEEARTRLFGCRYLIICFWDICSKDAANALIIPPLVPFCSWAHRGFLYDPRWDEVVLDAFAFIDWKPEIFEGPFDDPELQYRGEGWWKSFCGTEDKVRQSEDWVRGGQYMSWGTRRCRSLLNKHLLEREAGRDGMRENPDWVKERMYDLIGLQRGQLQSDICRGDRHRMQRVLDWAKKAEVQQIQDEAIKREQIQEELIRREQHPKGPSDDGSIASYESYESCSIAERREILLDYADKIEQDLKYGKLDQLEAKAQIRETLQMLEELEAYREAQNDGYF